MAFDPKQNKTHLQTNIMPENGSIKERSVKESQNVRLKVAGLLLATGVGLYCAFRLFKHTSRRIVITQMNVFPVKSCRGFSPKEWPTTSFGFLGDRQWLIYRTKCGTKSQFLEDLETPDDEGYVERKRFVTQRENNKLALLSTKLELNDAQTDWKSLELSAPGMKPIVVAQRGDREETRVDEIRMFFANVSGFDEGDDVSQWLTAFLSKDPAKRDEFRLLRLDKKNHQRGMPTTPLFPDRLKGRIASFVDVSPFSIISEATVKDIDARVKKGGKGGGVITSMRFRMNLVVESNWHEAFIEDTFRECFVSGIKMHCQPAFRCIIPNVNPKTAKREREPTTTLRTYRKDEHLPKMKAIKEDAWDMFDNKVYVGMHAVNEYMGNAAGHTFSVGASIEVLSTL